MPGVRELILLLILPMPIASIAWTVTHEEIFREMREWFERKSTSCHRLYQRKFFYMFTCEYCFSHYVVLGTLLVTHYWLFYHDWRGYLISGFSLVWIANIYMSFFGRIRLDIRRERVEIAAQQKNVESDRAARPRSSAAA